MFREADFMSTKQDRRLLAEVYDQLRAEKKAAEQAESSPAPAPSEPTQTGGQPHAPGPAA